MTARRISFALLLSLFALATPRAMAQCVSLTTLGSAYTQNFNTLSNTAGSTTNNLTLTGWFMTETGGGARDNEQYAVDTGGSNTGDTFSYGPAGNTDRALGGLQSGTLIPVIGSCYTNNTGGTISSLDIAYTGEQWRIGNTAAARDDRMDFQYSLNATSLTTGTWTDVNALDFTNPIKTNATATALDGNASANRTAISQSIAALSIANGATFWIRWNDLNASGADDGLAVDDFSLTPQGSGPPPLPTLNISDVTLAEGNAGTTNFTFAVTLSAPAGPGGVTFDIATADGTAQDDNPATEDNDYVANSATGQSIPMGSTGPVNFTVTVNGDTTTEANETFFVNVTNVVGANPGDVQGQGTINNDDVTIVLIHDVQGNSTTSPVVGATVTIRGIVTLLKSNGFFLQEELADYDADPNTSEGIFVFTSSAPTVAVGDDATVTGTVVEFNGLTEISPATAVTINSTGNVLPTAVTLTVSDLPTTATPAQPQLEKYEGMRVLAPSLTTVAPNDNFFDVDTVLTGVTRPMREPGIPVSDPIPPDPTTGLPDCCIPIWDENPERLAVDTNGRAGSTGETLTSNVTLTSVSGPLDFAFGRYRLIAEANLTRSANMSAVPVPLPAADEFTIAGYNIENFNNNATQRQKAALTIRDVLRLPDIIGTVEIYDLADLQALANEIQTISGVTYSAHLIEQDGTSEDNDQDVGYLVKTSRVSVTSVTAERATETYINPNTGLSELLHDRPPLVLRATVDPSGPAPQPVIVVVNHLRSFIDVDLVAGEGVRVREKRKKQAESLAGLLQELQTNNSTTPVISVGDYNAFQFNSGYDDSLSVITGAPTPDDQIVVDQSPDLVNPDFFNLLLNVPADQRYSFIFENTPQSLDHVVVNTVAQAINTAIAVARVNADFPSAPASAFESNAAVPEANSDHDPVVSYFRLPAVADLSVTKTDNVDPVSAGQNFFYTITVDNAGPDPADTVSWSDALPAGTTFVSLSQPGGWTCTTPSVGANGTVTCSIASLGVTSAAFTLTVAVDAGLASGTVLSNTATVTSMTADPDATDKDATETTTVSTSADLLLSKTDSPDPVTAGLNLTYSITVSNAGPSAATSVTLSDTLPTGTTFVSLASPAGWSCTTPSTGGTGAISCSIASLTVTSAPFTLVVNVDPALVAGTVLSNTATVSSATSDPNTGNESASETTTVNTSADVQVTKVDSPDPVTAGTGILYTITVTNAGPSAAANVTLSDTLPPGTTFASFVPAAGWTCPVPPGLPPITSIVCTNPSLAPGTTSTFTLGVTVDPAATNGTVITNTATVSSTTTDPSSTNNTATATTTVGVGSADIGVTKVDTPDPVNAGSNLTYTITVTNAGPTNAASASLSDTLPANTTFVSIASPAGWSCITPAAGGTGTVTCTNASFAPGNAVFTLVVRVGASTPSGTVISNTATVSSTTADPATGNESATATTDVTSPASVSGTKSVAGSFAQGSSVTYTVVLTNSGVSAQQDNPGDEFVDVLPSSLVLTSASATSGTATASVATNTVTWNGSILPGGSVTITINATIANSAGPGTVVSNQGTIHYDADGNGTNESTRATDAPAQPGSSDPTTFTVAAAQIAAIPTLDELALMALAAMLALLAVTVMRR